MNKSELIKLIKESSDSNRVLRISYTDSKNEQSIRNVEPYEIRGDNLWAYCRKKKGIRQFKLNNISKAKVTTYTYLPKWPIKMDEPLKKTASFTSERFLYGIPNFLFGEYEKAEVE